MTTTTSLGTTIGRLAARQYGLVTRSQLDEEGVSRHALRRAVLAGRVVQVGKHVYGVPGAPSSWERSALAACLDLGPGALLSHRSAAAVWDLGLGRGQAIHVTVPSSRRPRPASARVAVHRSRTLTDNDATFSGRLPVTTVERTLVDLAAILEAADLGKCAHNALCRRIVTPEQVGAAVDRLGPAGRTGIIHLRRVLVPWLSGNGLESVAEGEVWRTIIAAGLPEPVTRYEVTSPDGEFVARLDFAWPGRRVALEVDGFRWHANPRSQVEDAVRANRLAALGWIVLRTTPAENAAGGADFVAALRYHLSRDLGGDEATRCGPKRSVWTTVR